MDDTTTSSNPASQSVEDECGITLPNVEDYCSGFAPVPAELLQQEDEQQRLSAIQAWREETCLFHIVPEAILRLENTLLRRRAVRAWETAYVLRCIIEQLLAYLAAAVAATGGGPKTRESMDVDHPGLYDALQAEARSAISKVFGREPDPKPALPLSWLVEAITKLERDLNAYFRMLCAIGLNSSSFPLVGPFAEILPRFSCVTREPPSWQREYADFAQLRDHAGPGLLQLSMELEGVEQQLIVDPFTLLKKAIWVDAETMTAWLNDEPYALSSVDATRFVSRLVENLGRWVSSTDMADSESGSVPRFDRLLRKVPTAIRRLIESSTKLGYRITEEAVTGTTRDAGGR